MGRKHYDPGEALFSVKKISDREIQRTLGETLRRLRKCARISQDQLAQVLNLHQTAVCRIEAGSQNLEPWHLQQLAEIFGVPVSSLLAGQVNYWQVATKYGQKPPFPEKYRDQAHTKVREMLPLLTYVRAARGGDYLFKVIDELEVDLVFLSSPDQPVSTILYLDILRSLIKEGLLANRAVLKKIVAEARSEGVQGFLHPIYATQENVLNLMKSLVLNAHHYESNFTYKMESESKDCLEVSATPAAFLNKLGFKDELIGDYICEYRKEFYTQFPKYIGAKLLDVKETQCSFRGADSCVYELRFK